MMITAKKLYKWADDAIRGEQIEYFSGELSREVALEEIRGSSGDATQIKNAAWDLYECGKITLVQKSDSFIKFVGTKNTPVSHGLVKNYSYLAVRL